SAIADTSENADIETRATPSGARSATYNSSSPRDGLGRCDTPTSPRRAAATERRAAGVRERERVRARGPMRGGDPCLAREPFDRLVAQPEPELPVHEEHHHQHGHPDHRQGAEKDAPGETH